MNADSLSGGIVLGFGSIITEKYHNTIIPEFRIRVSIVFVISMIIVILFTKSKIINW